MYLDTFRQRQYGETQQPDDNQVYPISDASSEVHRPTPVCPSLDRVWGSADKPSCIWFRGGPTIDMRGLSERLVHLRGLLLVERISSQYEIRVSNVSTFLSGCWAGCIIAHKKIIC